MAQLFVVRREGQGFLAMMPHPDAVRLPAELAQLRSNRVATLVSLLEPDERESQGLTDTGNLCAQHGIQYVSHPVPDFGTPADAQAFAALALTLKRDLLDGSGIVVHCRAGIGRSGLLVASVLVALGASPTTAFAEVSTARGETVPEAPAQGRWLKRHRKLLHLG